MKKILLLFIILIVNIHIHGQQATISSQTEYMFESDILYYNKSDTLGVYAEERCRLDIYYPTNKSNFKTVVWFHGGGLRAGEKSIPEELKNKGIAVVAANYRLFPEVKAPIYIEDAAAAVAWVFKNIKNYNGNPAKIYLSGHSAGGYLVSMIGMNKSYLRNHKIDADSIAGLIPFSGHTITHFTIREERGIPGEQAIIDEFAPLFHVRPNVPPIVLITGDRELEMLGRYEENAYLMRMMKVVGHKNTLLYEIQGFDHGSMVKPAFSILLNYLKSEL